MTKIIGLTGGIASGKTTVIHLIEIHGIPTHESDFVVKNMYSKPTLKFINYLKKINLGQSVSGKKINKNIIREEIFNNQKKRKALEKYIHTEVKKSRERFLKKNINTKTKILFLDIPLLFENKLEKICDYTIFLYSPLKLRRQRAIRRKGMKKNILEKIINTQLSDKIKRNKADFVINTFNTKASTHKALNKIIDKVSK